MTTLYIVPQKTPANCISNALSGSRQAGHLKALGTQTASSGGLSQLLTEDIQLYADGGGKVSAATEPLYEKYHILRFFEGQLFAS